MARPKLDVKAEAIRLRIQERLSLKEIAKIAHASQGSLSVWLREYPLTPEEKKESRLRNRTRVYTRKQRGDESPLHQMVGDRVLTSHDKAKISEAAVLLRLVIHQFRPFGAIFDGEKTDWMVEDPETKKTLRLQVKSVRHGEHGLPYFALYCTEGHNRTRKYHQGEFDFIVGYDFYADIAYVYSFDEVVANRATVSVRPDAAERWDKLHLKV